MLAYCDYNLKPCGVKIITSAKLFLSYVLGLALNSGGIPHYFVYPRLICLYNHDIKDTWSRYSYFTDSGRQNSLELCFLASRYMSVEQGKSLF